MALSDSTERKLLWDEENRLGAININGFISGYWYDASGERVIKSSGDDEGMYVNDVFSGARTMTDNFTAYINPYLVVSKGGQYTKHIYIGSQRIVSKLGDLDSYGQDPRRIEYAGSNVEGAKIDYAAKYKQSQQTIKDNYAHFEVEYNGIDNDDYVNGEGFCCEPQIATRSFIPQANDNPELFQYYYHSDHLGSSSLITNLDGEVVQHIEYVPFGEVFIEERNNKWNTPYLFNAKELDEETGLYYYGARYYDSRLSIWISTDPLQEKYPNISTYAYCFGNPITYFDPNGMDGWTRFWGGVRAVGGAFQMIGGGALVLAPEPTCGTVVVGCLAFAHGVDDFQTGWNQMWSGEEQNSITQQATQAGLEAVGVDPETAKIVATGVDMGGGLLGGGFGAYKTFGMLSKAPVSAQVDIFGGAVSRYKGFINYDTKAVLGIADDISNFSTHFPKGSVSKIIADNPQADFLQHVVTSLEKGGTITVRGGMSNKHFNRIWNGTAEGLENYKIISKTEDVTNPGFLRSDGVTPVGGVINEIVLQVK